MGGKVATLEDIQRCFAPLLETSAALRAIVYGSYARGDADEYSDNDQVIIKETDLRFLDRFTDFERLSQLTPKTLELLVYTPGELADMLEKGPHYELFSDEDAQQALAGGEGFISEIRRV